VRSVQLAEINIYTTLQVEVTVSQSDWHKVCSVYGLKMTLGLFYKYNLNSKCCKKYSSTSTEYSLHNVLTSTSTLLFIYLFIYYIYCTSVHFYTWQHIVLSSVVL